MKRNSSRIDWQKAPDIKRRILYFAKNLNLNWLKMPRIFVYRSYNSASRAYARTWAFPRIWQLALHEEPAYIIEVLSERFDKLSSINQDKVILHEITHIPKNFSGSLIPHIRRGKRNFHSKVEELINQYIRMNKE